MAIYIILGAIFGSFANVCIHRIPKNSSIAYPPSHCPKCKKPLKPMDLLPIFSFFMLKGKCSYCRQNISYRYVIVEIIMAASFGYFWVISSDSIYFLFYAAHFFILFTLSVIDLEHMILSNKLILAGVTLAIVFSLFDIGQNIFTAILGGLTGLLLLTGIYYLSGGKMGGGDIKLLAYIGMLVGPVSVFFVLFIGALIGIIIHIPLSMFLNKKIYGQVIPFGPYLALSGIINMVYGDEILHFWLSNIYSMP